MFMNGGYKYVSKKMQLFFIIDFQVNSKVWLAELLLHVT